MKQSLLGCHGSVCGIVCCAIVVNQLKLCNERLFSYLAELMVTSSNDLPSTLIIAVAFLSGCLMSNNVQGQKLAKDTGLLSKLMTMFR